MEPMHEVYSVEVTTLSPLHIGTGDVLQKGFDYVVHNGRTWVVHADALLDAVWGPGRAVTTRTVDVYILRLRQKIEQDPASPDFIRSARGFGYSFSPAFHNPVTDL